MQSNLRVVHSGCSVSDQIGLGYAQKEVVCTMCCPDDGVRGVGGGVLFKYHCTFQTATLGGHSWCNTLLFIKN